MSTSDIISLCANCGKSEENTDSLKACTACKMVKYCNRDCQIAHRPQHKKACKKRAAELHDEKLFKQPPPKGDCPICMLLLPSLHTGSMYRSCCGKRICSGCIHAVSIRDGGVGLCPFCRTPSPTPEEMIEQMKKRVELGDAQAIYNLGVFYSEGLYGLPQDHAKASELYHQAGELGHTRSYFNIGILYYNGDGVERDEKKALHYWELAAMGGDTEARHNLGYSEYYKKSNWDRALKHWLIAAGGGSDNSVKGIQQLYMDGYATKEDYTKALQTYQKCIDEIRSEQRDQAAAFDEAMYKYY